MHRRAIVDSQALNVRFDASSLHKSPGERIERERESLVPTNLMEHRTRDVIRPRTHPLYSRLF